MKNYKTNLSTYDGKIYIAMVLLLCLFFVLVIFFFSSTIWATDSQVKSKPIIEEFYENENPIDLQSVIEKNTSVSTKEEMVIEETDMEYTTRYKNNAELPNGVVQVLEEGRVGKENAVIIKKYENDELISEEQVAQNIIKAPVDRIVEIGTGIGYTNYKINEGDTVYVVSNTAAIRLNANENAEKICTLNKNETAKVLKIEGSWCYVVASSIKGYIQTNCVTNKSATKEVDSIETNYTKQQLLAKLNFNMDLREPSGFTLEQFKKVLSNDANDKNYVFSRSAEYFYYVEKQYHINGIFVAAVGIHESGWGTSAISKNKGNLFGYGAVDSNPSGGAYSFNSYSEGIDLVSRVFVKYYLNPPGTKIYDGTAASGKFYSGSTLSAVNSKYASDKNWANSVYKWMEYLYNKL